MTNEAKVAHDAYVSIGWDELFYVGCDDCPEKIFGPNGNDFEANGIAIDHGRNPSPRALHVPPPACPPHLTPTVIPPTWPGVAWSVGPRQWPALSPLTPPPQISRHLEIVHDERSRS